MTVEDAVEVLAALEVPGWAGPVQEAMGTAASWQVGLAKRGRLASYLFTCLPTPLVYIPAPSLVLLISRIHHNHPHPHKNIISYRIVSCFSGEGGCRYLPWSEDQRAADGRGKVGSPLKPKPALP